jgi:hypothetical protein
MLYSGLLDIIITIVLNVLVWSRRLSVAEPAWREVVRIRLFGVISLILAYTPILICGGEGEVPGRRVRGWHGTT